MEKLKEIKSGKVGIDLFSILLNEGGETYSPLGDLAEVSMFDDVMVMYFASRKTTSIAIANLMKYVHMEKYLPVRIKL